MGSFLGFGLGLRSEFIQDVLAGRHSCDWFEVISERLFGLEGGNPYYPIGDILKIRRDYPIVMHGVSMSVGSAQGVDPRYLKKLKFCIDQVEPEWVSDHFCWTQVDGESSNDLLPLPYTQESIELLVRNIGQVQEYLKRPMMFENVSSYIGFQQSEMTEWEFISEVARRSGCKVLFDVNNIFVSGFNHEFDPVDFINGIARELVGQIHLAGPSDEGHYMLDTHDSPVREEVWKLYDLSLKKFGMISTNIERDSNIPPLIDLEAELTKAKNVFSRIFGGMNALQI